VGEDANEASFLYLDTVGGVERFTSEISATREIALDTEGASFHRFVDRIYLLQLSTRQHHAVIDPLPIGVPSGLGALLEDPSVEVVFHDADYDLRLLQQDYGWHVRTIFDTRIAAQLLGYTAFGLAALLERFFDVKLDKKHQRADWSMRPLTADMLDYAAQDTRFLLQHLSGQGTAWLELSGELIMKDLAPGEMLRVHPGHVGAFMSTVSFQITTVPGIKNMIFGGDGIFLAQLVGPGRIWLQTLPLSRLAHQIAHYLPHTSREVPSAAGAGVLGGIVGSILSGGE